MEQLTVNIVDGTDMIRRDFWSKSDPYVMVFVDNKLEYRTKHQRNKRNPKWHERCSVTLHGQEKKLHFRVMDKDTFKKDDWIGSAEVDLSELSMNEPIEMTLRLYDEKRPTGNINVEITLWGSSGSSLPSPTED